MQLKARITEMIEDPQSKKIRYRVKITDQQNRELNEIQYRYSEFETNHEKIQKNIKRLNLKIILPKFPGKGFIFSTNHSTDRIVERKKQLEQYLNQLLHSEKILGLDSVGSAYTSMEVEKYNEQCEMEISIANYIMICDTVLYEIKLKQRIVQQKQDIGNENQTTHSINTGYDYKEDKIKSDQNKGISSNQQEWSCKLRYSDLLSLHWSLQNIGLKSQTKFPKRKLISGITNESNKDIDKRKNELQAYLKQVFGNKQMLKTQAMRYFIYQIKIESQKIKKFYELQKKKILPSEKQKKSIGLSA